MDSPRLSRFTLAVLTQFVAASILLRYAYPILWDGEGPEPTFFYFGHLPSLGEYHNREWQYDVRFLLPYIVAAVVLAFVTSFIAPQIAKRFHSKRPTVFAFTVFLLFGVAALSDVVVRAARLNAGVFLTLSSYSIIACLVVVLPLALLAAVFTNNY